MVISYQIFEIKKGDYCIFKLAIFDWNGTLINDRKLIYRMTREIALTYDFEAPTFEDMLQNMSHRYMDFFYARGLPKEVTLEPIWDICRKVTERHWKEIKLHDGARDLLNVCKELGMKMAIVSGEQTSVLTKRLKQFKIGHYFDLVESGLAGDKKVGLRRVLQKLEIKPKQAFYIDDTHHGIIEAQSVGLRTFGFTEGHNARNRILDAKPSYVVGNLWDARSIILYREGEKTRK